MTALNAGLFTELVRLMETRGLFAGPTSDSPPDPDFGLMLAQAMAAKQDASADESAPVQRAPLQSLGGLVNRVAAAVNLPAGLLRAVVRVESGGDPHATSSAGAMGLMQLMPGTAASLGVIDAYDPVQNLYGGARYLKGLLGRYGGDVRLALAAYNAGPGTLSHLGVTDWERDKAKLPAETQAYVPMVLEQSGAWS